jgi:hypothetical protein
VFCWLPKLVNRFNGLPVDSNAKASRSSSPQGIAETVETVHAYFASQQHRAEAR